MQINGVTNFVAAATLLQSALAMPRRAECFTVNAVSRHWSRPCRTSNWPRTGENNRSYLKLPLKYFVISANHLLYVFVHTRI